MTLIFQTPSKRCPFRRKNGNAVEIVSHLGSHITRRSGLVEMYGVRDVPLPMDGSYNASATGWIAFSDELFIEPSTQSEPRGSLVGTMDEYGTIWDGEPGASKVIGDVVSNDRDETHKVYLTRGAA